MPELPEVETVRRGLAPAMEGRRFEAVKLNRPDLRFPMPENFVGRITGAELVRLGRRAKFLTAELSTGETLVMHLGMTGRFTVKGDHLGDFHYQNPAAVKHDHVVFGMSDGISVTYNDPRRFGFMELWPSHIFDTYPRLVDLGPEPLTNHFSAAALDGRLRHKNTPVKSALLDQKVVAGLGNIYVCEALFLAGISPRRRAKSIARMRTTRLTAAINQVIANAIDAGGSSISDFANASGDLGYFQHQFNVYDRENQPCNRCSNPIKRIVQSGRSSFFCSRCQG